MMALSRDTSRESSESESESLPFLESGEKQHSQSQVSRDWLPTRKGILAHIFVLILYVSVSVFLLKYMKIREQECWSDGLWSPAQEAVEWEDRRLTAFLDTSRFAGPPSPEVDEAWSDVMSAVNIKILPEEMDRLGTSSIKLRDGSGYVGLLSVYHELHCVKTLRHWFYRDYYHANMTEEESIKKQSHAEHCLEELRVSAACRGDTSVIPYYWLHGEGQDDTLLGMSIRDDKPLHRCVKWEPLHTWAKSRRVNLRDPNLAVPENETD